MLRLMTISTVVAGIVSLILYFKIPTLTTGQMFQGFAGGFLSAFVVTVIFEIKRRGKS